MFLLDTIKTRIKRIAGVKRSGYRVDRKEYYLQFLYPFTFSDFFAITSKEATLITKKEIKCRKFEFGSTMDEVIAFKGTPNYILNKRIRGHKYTVLFFKVKRKGKKCIIQYHFIEGKAFFCGYTYRDNLNDSQRSALAYATISEYTEKADTISNLFHQVIGDRKKNLIFFRDCVDYSVFNLTGDVDTINLVRSLTTKSPLYTMLSRASMFGIF